MSKEVKFNEGDTVEVKGSPSLSAPIQPSVPESLIEQPTKAAKKGAKNKRYTVAGIVKDDTITFGISACSEKDQFFKRRGRLISEGRAKYKPCYKIDVEKVATKGLAFRQTAEMLVKHLQDGITMVQKGQLIKNLT